MIAEAVAAITLTRGPVAESVTQRSAIISFRTSARDHDSVLLQNGTRIDAGTGVSHVARLTRLTPGEHYAYTVEGGSGALATGTFRAAPVGTSRFTFAVVGDFGSGTSDETAVASLIQSWHPDFVLTVGDNAYPMGSKELLDRDIFRPYAAVMRESAWFPALGNHDVMADGGEPELERSTPSAPSAGIASPGATPTSSYSTPTAPSRPARRSCVSRAGRWRAARASASPPGTTRRGSRPAGASAPAYAATSCRWCREMASRLCSSATCTPTPGAARTTGSCTWRSGPVGTRCLATPAR